MGNEINISHADDIALIEYTKDDLQRIFITLILDP